MNRIHQLGDLIKERYQVIKVIGRGNMGVTYSANNLNLRQKVAVKVVFLTDITDWKILELFEREAKVLANLAHPNIPKYVDYFEEKTDTESYFCLVQELIEGESLAKLVENGRKFSEEEVKEIARQTLKILVYLQGLNPPLIHRDIKPQNIILTAQNLVYLVDFGTVQDVYRNTVSIGGTFVGTLGYMPPEQFRGQTLLSSDLYSLGATLIFLITGKSPADLPQKNLKIDFYKYAFLAEYFAIWLEKMVEPMAEDRYNSATEALGSLESEIKTKINPVSDRIDLSKQSHKLFVKIKPLGWQFTTILSLIKCLIWDYFLVVIPWFNLLKYIFTKGVFQINVFGLILLLGSTLFGLYLLINFLNQLVGYTCVELTPNKFKIRWKSPTLKKNKLGNTLDITRLEVISHTKNIYHQSYSLVLWYGIKRYLIAEDLTRLESENLLNYFDQFLTENGLNIEIKF